jgi:8-amino-7-oxononanoate synthase
MYSNELKAIKKSNRYRNRIVYDDNLIDLASNDYLGLARKKQLFKKAYANVDKFCTHAPKSSQLVNGYHQIHKDFEEFLCKQNGFEDAIVVGSGFLANLSLIEALPRKGDLLILDEEYHASGHLASKLVDAQIIILNHNSAVHLENILKNRTYKRAIIAVEGIYSMSGDLLNKEIFHIIKDYKNTILIVDEAHSGGVVGDNLGGVYDLYDIKIQPNHIKMGTLGKAYGSYGAYILASSHIISFLQNRAKALIYATAPSVIDIALGHQSMLYILKNKNKIKDKIKKRQKLIKEFFDKDIQGLIFPYTLENTTDALKVQEVLIEQGFLVGAIRPPTVEKSILRIIPKIDIKISMLKKLFTLIEKEKF